MNWVLRLYAAHPDITKFPSFPDNEANTIAGLVIHEAQHIPNVGQVFNFYGFRFEILTKEKNKITKIKLAKII